MNSSRGLHAVIGCLSHRRPRADFDLSDGELEAPRFEVTEVKRLAVDQDGEILARAGDGAAV